MKKVLVLVNQKSGIVSPYRYLEAIDEVWDQSYIDLSFQFSRSIKDGTQKVARAIKNNVDTILVIGGDGMVNSIGSQLVHTSVKLGVMPAGSGNGFARHFQIPLNPEEAAIALFHGKTQKIDAGLANGRMFFITCSMAWDGALVESFEKFPFRGLVPYVLAGAQQLLEYRGQPFFVEIDDKEMRFKNPLIFTVANLSQFGSDVLVAPDAQANNGLLELVSIERNSMPIVLSQIHRFIERTFHKHPHVINLHFKKMIVRRENPSPVQIDGELLDPVCDVNIEVIPRALNVIIP